METAIYISVICIVAVALVAIFVLMQRKDKKRYEKLQNEAKKQQPVQEISVQEPAPVENIDCNLEEFSLEEEKEKSGKISLNPFDDDEDDRIFDLDEFDDYEQFLRDEFNVEDEEEVNLQQPRDFQRSEPIQDTALTRDEEDFIKAEIMNRKKYEDE